MKRFLCFVTVLFFSGFFASHLTVNVAQADEATSVKGSKSNSDNRQVQPGPGADESTTVKSSKSNSSERQMQPVPDPVEGKSVKGSKSNTSE